MAIHTTATARGGIWKASTCEHCQAQYAYFMTATGRGHKSATVFTPLPDATAKASAHAESDLVRALEGGIGKVWCPECGHYPERLFPMLRWRATRFHYLVALVPLFAMLVYAGAVQRTTVYLGVLHNMEMNLVSFPFESGAIWFVVTAAALAAGVCCCLDTHREANRRDMTPVTTQNARLSTRIKPLRHRRGRPW